MGWINSGSASTFALVIPTHRRPGLVSQAVGSALRQRRRFDEVIVVCDGLGDPAIDALAGLPITITAVERAGVAHARNRGSSLASSEWICFLDDDDLLHPDYLSRIEDYALRNESMALNTWYWTFGSVDVPGVELRANDLDECLDAAEETQPFLSMEYLDINGRSFDRLLERLRGSMSTSAVRRDVLSAAGGFPEGMTSAEDWTMYVNVARLTEWHVVPERLGFFRDHARTNTRVASVTNGLMTLRAIRSFWEPSALPEPPHRPLAAYRAHYRHVLGWTLSAAASAGDARAWLHAWRLSRGILRLPDRMQAALPAPLRRAGGALVRRVPRRD